MRVEKRKRIDEQKGRQWKAPMALRHISLGQQPRSELDAEEQGSTAGSIVSPGSRVDLSATLKVS